MLKFLRILIVVVYCIVYVSANAQNNRVELSIQQGHSSDILEVDISSNNLYLATFGSDNKLVLWYLKSGSQIYFTYVPGNVESIAFDDASTLLRVFTSDKTYELDLANSILKEGPRIPVPVKSRAALPEGTVEIEGANIKVVSKGSNKKTARKTSDYFTQPFHSVVYSHIHKKIYAACEDGYVYIYTPTLKYRGQLKGHLASVNDLVLSPDEKFLYTASSDRSIIKWDLATEKADVRISGRTYPTYGVSTNLKGTSVAFGDEVGFIKEINLEKTVHEIKTKRPYIYPLTHSFLLTDSTKIYGGLDNTLYIEKANAETEKVKILPFSLGLGLHSFIVKGLNMYQPFYTGYYDVQLNPSESLLAYSSKSRKIVADHYRVVDLRTGRKSPKLFQSPLPPTDLMDGLRDIQISNVNFLSDSVFFTINTDKGIHLWLIREHNVKKIYERIIPVSGVTWKAVKINEQNIALLLGTGELHTLNISTEKVHKTDITGADDVWHLQDNLVAWTDADNQIHIATFDSGAMAQKGILTGHQDKVTSVAHNALRNVLFSTSKDATVRVWGLENHELLVTIVPVGSSNAIYITPDNYYMMTGKDLSSFGFKVQDKYFYPEQFDPYFNRPDIVLQRLGYADSSLVKAYYHAYQKRLKKMGFTEDMLKSDFHLPEIEIENFEYMPTITEEDTITLNLRLKDEKYELDRINVWINDVAVFGSDGISLRDKNVQQYSTNVPLKLAKGNNKIQVSALNIAGAESFKETVDIRCTKGKEKPDLYIIALGVSDYEEKEFNLTYAAKDAEDLVKTLQKSKIHDKVHEKVLLNSEVTKTKVTGLQTFLQQAGRNDEVIIFFAGHGVLDDQMDYYLAAHDMNFAQPAAQGIAYDEIEKLLDGIQPLKKLLLIDACHSGEIDKDEVRFATDTLSPDGKSIVARNVGRGIELNDEQQIGLQNTSQLTKQLFADLRRGTGSTVIAASGGMEFAMESARWKNGLFTYSLLNGLQTKSADLNKDGVIMLSELKKYVSERVAELSNGRQQPTSRIENTTIDYRVW